MKEQQASRIVPVPAVSGWICDQEISGIADDTTCNFIPGISGRLRGKIIPLRMDDHRAAQNILYTEPFVIKCAPGIALVAQQRQQVSDVLRVRLHGGIVMLPGFGKAVGAVAVLVDVQGIKVCGSLDSQVGQAENLRLHQDATVWSIIEFNEPAYLRIGRTAPYPRDCLGTVILKQLDEGKARCW